MAVIESAYKQSYSINTGTISYEAKRLSAKSMQTKQSHARQQGSTAEQQMAQQYQQTGTVDPIQFAKAVGQEVANNPYLSEPLKAFVRLNAWDIGTGLVVRAGNWLGKVTGGPLPALEPQVYEQTVGEVMGQMMRGEDIYGGAVRQLAPRVLGPVARANSIFGATQMAGGGNPRPGTLPRTRNTLDPDIAASYSLGKATLQEAQQRQHARNAEIDRWNAQAQAYKAAQMTSYVLQNGLIPSEMSPELRAVHEQALTTISPLLYTDMNEMLKWLGVK